MKVHVRFSFLQANQTHISLSAARTSAHRKAHRARRVSPKGALLGNVSIMQDKGF
jgi:hypothetical protein